MKKTIILWMMQRRLCSVSVCVVNLTPVELCLSTLAIMILTRHGGSLQEVESQLTQEEAEYRSWRLCTGNKMIKEAKVSSSPSLPCPVSLAFPSYPLPPLCFIYSSTIPDLSSLPHFLSSRSSYNIPTHVVTTEASKLLLQSSRMQLRTVWDVHGESSRNGKEDVSVTSL